MPGNKTMLAPAPMTRRLVPVAGFIALIWIVFLLDRFLPLEQFGLVPRRISGLAGIVAMPFLHGTWSHLIHNTIPLAVLLALLTGSRRRPVTILVVITLLSGTLLWLFGRTALHIGASGLVFGLAVYFILVGVLERRYAPLAISLCVAAAYGSSLLWGILPVSPGISWDGHLAGAAAGGITAYLKIN